jgi:hypothetical protein
MPTVDLRCNVSLNTRLHPLLPEVIAIYAFLLTFLENTESLLFHGLCQFIEGSFTIVQFHEQLDQIFELAGDIEHSCLLVAHVEPVKQLILTKLTLFFLIFYFL